MTILITGSRSPTGTMLSGCFAELGFDVHGINNARRAPRCGPEADRIQERTRALARIPRFVDHELDTDNRRDLVDLIAAVRPDAVVHAATQTEILPAPEFAHANGAAVAAATALESGLAGGVETSAADTMRVLEATRRMGASTPFVFLSSKSIYGEGPNRIALRKLASRWEFADARYAHGIPETFPIDECKVSAIGHCDVAVDAMVQEYGHYFGLPTVCLRLGSVVGTSGMEECLTQPFQIPFRGLIRDLVRCNIEERAFPLVPGTDRYVHDHIHALDVARFIQAFVRKPGVSDVYNIGGGRANACSIQEAVALIEDVTGKKQRIVRSNAYDDDEHICYYSDIRHAKADYPDWDVTIGLREIIERVAAEPSFRLAA